MQVYTGSCRASTPSCPPPLHPSIHPVISRPHTSPARGSVSGLYSCQPSSTRAAHAPMFIWSSLEYVTISAAEHTSRRCRRTCWQNQVSPSASVAAPPTRRLLPHWKNSQTFRQNGISPSWKRMSVAFRGCQVIFQWGQ